MTIPERLYRWNCWYNGLPQEWRFQVILWPIIAAGFLNMLLTLAVRFPFGLLVLVAVMCVAAIRAPYALGWISPAAADQYDEADARRFEVPGADWLIDLNQRYDALPHGRQFWVFPAVLLVAGAINMALTIGTGFSFGLLFLLALLALIAFRAPYVAGWLKLPPSAATPVLSERDNPRIAHESSPMFPAESRPVEAATLSVSAPPEAYREMQTADFDKQVVPSGEAKAASTADHDGSVATDPSPAPAATDRGTPAPDLDEQIVPSGEAKAASPADHHGSMVTDPSPAPAATDREMRTADLGEALAPPGAVKVEALMEQHDSATTDPSPADETPPAPAATRDEGHAADDRPTPPRSSSRKPNRTP